MNEVLDNMRDLNCFRLVNISVKRTELRAFIAISEFHQEDAIQIEKNCTNIYHITTVMLLVAKDSIFICVKTAVKLNCKTPKKEVSWQCLLFE